MTLPIELDPEEKGNSMNDPSAIPEDVMRAAQAVVNASHQPGAEKALLVARAIMAERERCAKVLGQMRYNYSESAQRESDPHERYGDLRAAVTCGHAAREIRKGTP